MARGGAHIAAQQFTGHQTVATVDALDAFVRTAQPGSSFVYCEAPALIRGETSDRVRDLAQQGLVSSHQERRAGGGWTFTVQRSRYKPAAPIDPVQDALADPATAAIFRALKLAANFEQPCQSDTELARIAGLGSRDQAQWRVRKLVAVGLIESTLATENGVPRRVVTICETRKRTALPPKWAALQEAAARDARGASGDRPAQRDARSAEAAASSLGGPIQTNRGAR